MSRKKSLKSKEHIPLDLQQLQFFSTRASGFLLTDCKHIPLLGYKPIDS